MPASCLCVRAAWPVRAGFQAAERGVDVARGTEHLPTLAACLMFRAVVRGLARRPGAAVAGFRRGARAYARAPATFSARYLTHGWRGEGYLLAARRAPPTDLKRCLELATRSAPAFTAAPSRRPGQASPARRRGRRGAPYSAEALEVARAAHGLEPLDRLRPRRGAARPEAGPDRAGRGRDQERDRDPGAARMRVRPRLVAAGPRLRARRQGRPRVRARDSYLLAGRIFETMGVATGRKCVRAVLAKLDGGQALHPV